MRAIGHSGETVGSVTYRDKQPNFGGRPFTFAGTGIRCKILEVMGGDKSNVSQSGCDLLTAP